MTHKNQTNEAVGYAALIEKYSITALPHYRRSEIALKGRGYSIINDVQELHVYTKRYQPNNPNDPFQQLEFALGVCVERGNLLL